jgi:hypothetical protein
MEFLSAVQNFGKSDPLYIGDNDFLNWFTITENKNVLPTNKYFEILVILYSGWFIYIYLI